MAKKITLRGPVTSSIVESTDENSFLLFSKWLDSYNPLPKSHSDESDYYPISTENRLAACRIKARKLNLKVC